MSTDKSPESQSQRSLIKSTSIISAGTFSSRILGFIRDVILAKLFGTQATADAFFVAFRIPNLFRDLMGEGAANAAVVPVFSEYIHQKDKAAVWNFVNVIFAHFFIVLSLATLAGMILAPLIVPLIAPGFIGDPHKLTLTIQLTQLMFPYLILIGLTACSMGILYSFKSFFWPAFSPCLMNVAMIISSLLAAQFMKEPVVGLAFGVLGGGIWQLMAQLRVLRKMGMPLRWPQTMHHPGVQKIGKLLMPRLLGSGVYQLNIFVDTICASLSTIVGAGGISAIYYSNRIIQFPQAIFGLALATAMLPAMSSLASRGDFPGLKNTLIFSLKNIFLIMMPLSVLCGVLSAPIVRILFERGEFNAYSAQITSSAFFFSSLGLWCYGAVRVLVSTFHALQDTATPVKVAGICLVINLILNFLLMKPLKVGGIALASSIAVVVNFLLLFFLMNKKLGGLQKGFLNYLTRLSLASLGLGIAVFLGWKYIGISPEVIKLVLVSLMGGVVFLILSLVLKIEGVVKIFQEIEKRLGNKSL